MPVFALSAGLMHHSSRDCFRGSLENDAMDGWKIGKYWSDSPDISAGRVDLLS